MQLKLTTDYAIRTVLYLATQSGITPVADIGNKMGISENYLMKVLKALKDGGIVAGYQGKRGGYVLSKKPKEISLWEIMEIMESSMKINRCLEDDHFCSRKGTETCKVRRYYEKAQKDLQRYFSKVTIEAVLKGKKVV